MHQPVEIPVTLSVLDRLIDYEPGASIEVSLSRAQSLKLLRAAVRRDLEWVLNSRRIAFEPDAEFEELNRSGYVMGVMDFTAFSLANSSEQSRLLRHIQSVVQQFEPRLANVRITQKDDHLKTRSLRFRIEASLLIDPSPVRISFDTLLHLSSGEYSVQEES